MTPSQIPCSVAADTRRHQTREEARAEMYESTEAALYAEFCGAMRSGCSISTPGSSTLQTPINVLLRDALYERDGDAVLDQIRTLIGDAAAGHPVSLLASGLVHRLARAHAKFHVDDAVAEAAGEGVQ